MDSIIQELKNEHKKIIELVNKIEALLEHPDGDQDSLFQSFKEMFQQHDDAETRILYPCLQDFEEINKKILKGYQAHHMVDVGILELRILPYKSETWLPKFSVVRDSLLSHIEEEEQVLFPQAEKLLDAEKMKKLTADFKTLRS